MGSAELGQRDAEHFVAADRSDPPHLDIRPRGVGLELFGGERRQDLAADLAEAALWSGSGATLTLGEDPLTLFGEVGGQVLAALPAEQLEADPTGSDVEVRRIGTVGGDEVLGVPLAELRAAHEEQS